MFFPAVSLQIVFAVKPCLTARYLAEEELLDVWSHPHDVFVSADVPTKIFWIPEGKGAADALVDLFLVIVAVKMFSAIVSAS